MKDILDSLVGWMTPNQRNIVWVASLIMGIIIPGIIGTAAFVVCIIICLHSWL